MTVVTMVHQELVYSQEKRKSTSELAIRSILQPGIHTRGIKGINLREGKPPQDIVKNKNLQVAFVIDGTESMANDISGVQRAIDSFATSFRSLQDEGADNKLEFSVVVYRDKKSGDCEIVQKEFTTDIDNLKKKIASIKTKTGFPAFNELVDVGIFRAIDSLKWSSNENTVKWIIVFGDAPPYPESNIKLGGYVTGREYSDNELIAAAKAVNVSLNFVLCNSGFAKSNNRTEEQLAQLKELYYESVPETKEFMDTLANATEGFVFDLSDESKIVKLAAKAAKEFIKFSPITADEVQATRIALKENIGVPLRIAILPHVTKGRLSMYRNGDNFNPGALSSIQLTRKLNLPGLLVSSRKEVNDALKTLDLNSIKSNDSLVVEMGHELSVDYLIWGDLVEEGNTIRMQSHVYSTTDGTAIASADELVTASELGRNNLVGRVAEKLMREFQVKVKTKKNAFLFVSTFDRSAEKQIRRPYGKEYRVSEKILKGLNHLEKSVEFKTGETGASNDLKKAFLQLTSALKIEPDNVHAHFFLASCLYNLDHAGADGETSNNSGAFKEHLKRAFELRTKSVTNDIRLEIEGDYQLFVECNVDAAIKSYRAIHENGAASEKSLKRANWMLAGIYAGEWGAGSHHLNLKESRIHVLNILARYESSSEAKFFKKQMNWDGTNGAPNPEFRASDYRLAGIFN